MLKLVLPLLLVGSNTFAANISCKVAQNPENMTATTRSEKGALKTEVVESASLIVGDEYNQDSIRLKVTTHSGISAEAYAFFNKRLGAYTVECDGGRMRMMATPNSLPGEVYVMTEGVRVDVLGCDGEMMISTQGTGTQFLPGACPAPSAN